MVNKRLELLKSTYIDPLSKAWYIYVYYNEKSNYFAWCRHPLANQVIVLKIGTDLLYFVYHISDDLTGNFVVSNQSCCSPLFHDTYQIIGNTKEALIDKPEL